MLEPGRTACIARIAAPSGSDCGFADCGPRAGLWSRFDGFARRLAAACMRLGSGGAVLAAGRSLAAGGGVFLGVGCRVVACSLPSQPAAPGVAIGFHGAQKLTQTATEGVGMRGEAWRQTLDLIWMQPWFGQGLPHYSSVFFLSGAAAETSVPMTHSHNLLLQLAFAFGVPITLAVSFLLLRVLWRARGYATTPGGFLAFAVIGCILVHSQVEFPLWYAENFCCQPVIFLVCSAMETLRLRLRLRRNGRFPVPHRHWTSPSLITRRIFAALLGEVPLRLRVWMTHDDYRVTPIFTPALPAEAPARLDEASRVAWFRQYSDFLRLLETHVDGSAIKATSIERQIWVVSCNQNLVPAQHNSGADFCRTHRRGQMDPLSIFASQRPKVRADTQGG